MSRVVSLAVVAVTVSWLGGCASGKAVLPAVEEASVQAQSVDKRAPSAAAALTTAQIQHLLMLLDRAEQSMKARRFTAPQGNNAWEDYREVLEWLPGHEEASAGLRKIADSYIDWGYAALRQGQYESARSYLSRATMVMPEHPAAQGLRAAIPARDQRTVSTSPAVVKRAPAAAVVTHSEPVVVAKTAAPPAAVTPVEAVVVPDGEASLFAIDRQQLRSRSGTLQAQLAGYADLIQARNSRVTIEAPSDADGRWLYQRLNDRREEYRIRANFRISKQPVIRLLD